MRRRNRALALIATSACLVSWASLPAEAQRVPVDNYDGQSAADPNNASYYKVIYNYTSTSHRLFQTGYIGAHRNYNLYFQGRADMVSGSDRSCGRVSNNVGQYGGSANGTCDIAAAPSGNVYAMNFRTCRSINNVPDPCTYYSADSKI